MSADRAGALGARSRRLGTPAAVGLAIGAGAAAGAAAQWAAAIEGQLLELTALTGLWVVLAVLLGRRAHGAAAAVLQATAFLAAMVAAFYAVWSARGVLAPVGVIVFWTLGAVTVGPLLGALGWASPRPDWWGALSVAAVGGLLAGEAVRLLLVQGFPPAAWLPVVFDLAAAVAFVLLAPGDSRRRALAVAVSPLVVGVATAGFAFFLPAALEVVLAR